MTMWWHPSTLIAIWLPLPPLPLPPPLQAAVAHPPPLPYGNSSNGTECAQNFWPFYCAFSDALDIFPYSSKKKQNNPNFMKICTSGSISTGSTGSTSSTSASCVLRTTGSQGRRKQWQHVETFNALLFRLHLFCDLIHFYCFLQHKRDTCNFIRFHSFELKNVRPAVLHTSAWHTFIVTMQKPTCLRTTLQEPSFAANSCLHLWE